jgi:hypothetical protein
MTAGDDKTIYSTERGIDGPTSTDLAQCPELVAEGSERTREEDKSQLLFKFTREKKPLPSPARARWIVWVGLR